MLYGNTRYWYTWGEPAADAPEDWMPELGVPTNALVEGEEVFRLGLQGRAAVPCTRSVLLRRAVVTEVGGFEDDFRETFTDQVFYAKVLLSGPVYVSSACWDLYRRHPDSACSIMKREGRWEARRTRYLEWLVNYLESRSLGDRRLRRIVRTELFLLRHPTVWRSLNALRRRVKKYRRVLGLEFDRT